MQEKRLNKRRRNSHHTPSVSPRKFLTRRGEGGECHINFFLVLFLEGKEIVFREGIQGQSKGRSRRHWAKGVGPFYVGAVDYETVTRPFKVGRESREGSS